MPFRFTYFPDKELCQLNYQDTVCQSESAKVGEAGYIDQIIEFFDRSPHCQKIPLDTYLFSDEVKVFVADSDNVYCLSQYMSKYRETPMGIFIQMIINWYNNFYLVRNPATGLLVTMDEKIASLYKFDHKDRLFSGENSGINLILPDNYAIPSMSLSYTINYQVQAESHPHYGYWLMPRSSITKTTLRQANSMGLIDTSYRGDLIMKVDNIGPETVTRSQGDSIGQLVLHNLRNHWYIQRVALLSTTARGAGGFGSTGR